MVKFHARRVTCAALTIIAVGMVFAATQREVLAAKPKPKPKAKPKTAAAVMPHPTGRVTYAFKMAPMSGTSLVTWVDGGKKFRQDMKMSGSPPGAPAGGATTNIEVWVIGDGTHLYTHQPMMGKQVYRMKMPKDGSAGAGPTGVPLGAMKEGKVIGKEVILGRTCEIRQVNTAKIWTWKGLALKMQNEGGQGPAMSMTATKLETPYKAAPTLFKVPSGYTVTDNLPGMGGMGGRPGGGAAPPVRKGSQ